MRRRLSLLMFLIYAPAGALIPLFSLRLEELGFTPMEIGWACATQAMAGLVAPLAAGQVADRWLAAERVLATYALIAGGLLWVLAGLTSPWGVIATALAFWLTMGPAITLGASISFAHLAHPERDYGRIRLWGTVGWVAPNLLLGYWLRVHSDLGDAMRLGGLFSIALAAYALTLPHTPPRRQAGSLLAPLAALRLLRGRAFGTYGVCALGVCAIIPFTSQVNPLFLAHAGIPRPWISPTLTIGQTTEVAFLAVLPMLLLRLGFRGTMLLGLSAMALALGILLVGYPLWFVVGSLALNGLYICCYLVAGQVFVNSQARGDVRASAQSLLTFINSTGMLIGNLLVGVVRGLAREEFRPTYAVGAGIAAALVVIFFAGFVDPAERPAAVTPGKEH